MEGKAAELETKLTQLQITSKRTDGIVQNGDEESIKRHQKTLKTIINDVETLRLAVESEKIVAKEDTTAWETGIQEGIAHADRSVNTTKDWLNERKKEQSTLEREEQIQFEVRLHETKLKLQAELESSKQTSSERPAESEKMIGMQAKLPKLVISKFNGAFTDWLRFWGQFTENIDQASIASITKFAYLRELLGDKVKHTVEALPFTPEGYNRAKSILLDKFGKESEIAKVHMREILDLPTIQGANLRKIHEFSDKLMYSIQALETMKKLDQVNGAVSMTLDKLPAIRGDLVRMDPEWEEWDFTKLAEALKQWTKRNPIEEKQCDRSAKRENLLHVSRRTLKARACVYCDETGHKANDCTKVTLTSERKQILARRRLCFNCANGNHKASECQSKTACQKCDKRHHTSICDERESGPTERQSNRDVVMTTGENSEGIFPVVVVEINGIRCRALIDSGAGSSYVSARLVELLRVKPSLVQTKNIDMLMASKVAKLEVYDLEFESVDHQYKQAAKVTKVNKSELLTIANPNYAKLLGRYSHLNGVTLNDEATKPSLPVHVVLGSGEYAKIKTETKPRIGREGEPIAELTKFGWFVMSPGQEFDNNVMIPCPVNR